ncbi:MAG: NAD(P)H-dependent glycerol-3-phosphate dehydrogenase [Pseudomonadota bacterium]|nr:NAD(P)H-dependent glycerol-3-phosphate dehydrogenase [Pseudomonadota bacterium]
MTRTSIIGSGAWALALSKILIDKNLVLKCRNLIKAKNKFKNKEVIFTNNFSDLKNSEYVFLAIPSQTIRENILKLRQKAKGIKATFIICSKGVERKTNKLMSEVIKDVFPKNNLAILSGPNFSSELIRSNLSASVLSCVNRQVLLDISKLISQKKFRIYFNNDIIGTQLGGAMKNVIAIACGFIKGKNLGENAQAAIITRGISEIVKLGLKMGAKRNTFYGLSGIGDLTLTCSSLKSRNTKLGFKLAKGQKIQELKKYNVLEGFESCDSICNLGKINNVELPICGSVKKILDGVDVNQIILSLLSRPLQFEN